jgi:DNA replication protein DnaC
MVEARARRFGHAELLQMLCEDELASRDAANVARLIRSARLPMGATLEEFDFSHNPKIPAAQARDLARLATWVAGPAP